MTIRFRSALLVTTLVFGAALLAACDDETDHDVTATASPTQTTVLTEEAKTAKAFVTHFRAQHPNLAKDRTDQEITTDGDDTCDLFQDNDANRADTIGEVSETFTANGIKPNDDTAIKIMTLAVKDLCPSRTTNLKAAL